MTDLDELDAMAADWRAESRWLRKQIVDQAAHLVAAFLLVATLGADDLLRAALLGLALGIVRETAQHGTLRLWALGWGSRVDLMFWSLGGLLGGLA